MVFIGQQRNTFQNTCNLNCCLNYINCRLCINKKIYNVFSGVCIIICVHWTSQLKLLELGSTWVCHLFIWACKAIDPGSNWDTDREEVGLFLILNKQANLHYSCDIFPWVLKTRQNMKGSPRYHEPQRHACFLGPTLERCFGKGSSDDKTYAADAVTVAVVLLLDLLVVGVVLLLLVL